MFVTALVSLLERDMDPRVFALLLGPLLATMFFLYVYRRYRNTDKSYQYEDRTRIELENIQHFDQYSRHISRTRNSKVEGLEQSRNPRRRLTGQPRNWWG
ncbi:hypothetical protein EII34_05780 [Arachnia propionica]|uniref:Uncharacterized protein n=1 Tax=Arachnia propionica TaxID=1750 RepID=A0A3P1T8N4_9ACTN|nr:hypothetical protein [Arachnia propionica]RRD05719.1 hypothetical protein EII34_05780 [Arachnia propionica]